MTFSLAEKVGQMFICGFDDTVPNSDITELIQLYHIGGIIYFRRNVESVQQIKALSHSLQTFATTPLMIAIDQEGGMVARIDKEVTPIPGNMALGATTDIEGAFQAARISGKELRSLGINMNFAPSLDVNNNRLNPVIGVRSYGECPDLVNRMGIATILGLQQSGMAATAKHFPGHGDTEVDSHHDLPIIKHDLTRLEEVELVPFKGAIEAGVDAIMTAHILFPTLDNSFTPATLSKKVLTGLLRNGLQYQGVIVTDCLEMKAIAGSVGVAEGAIRAIEAGADAVLVSHTFTSQKESIEAVIKAVQSGRISESRIDASVQRILAVKKRRNMDLWFDSQIAAPLDVQFIEQLSERTTTLVKDEGQLPLTKAATYVIWPELSISSEVDEVMDQSETLGVLLKQYLSNVTEERIGVQPTQAEINTVLKKSSEYEQVIFVSYNATFSKGQTQLVRQLCKQDGIKLIVAAARNPYDLLEFPEVKTYVACYENRSLAMKSLAKFLVGKIQAHGRLPVTISAEYPS